MKKTVMILVNDVKYYQQQESLVIVGVEAETRRPITQQITVRTFLENTKRFNAEEVNTVVNDPDRCRLLASNLKSRRAPFQLVFEDTQTDEERKQFFESEATRKE